MKEMTLDEAQDLAIQIADTFGFATFPIALGWNDDRQSVDKRPLTRHGHKDASTDHDEIRCLFANHLELGDGECLGCGLYPGPGVVVLDNDKPSALLELEAEHGRLPGLRVLSVSNRPHIYMTLPEGVEVSNRSPWPGFDVRSQNGWVVAPGTFCPWGSWEFVEGTELAEAPSWVLEALRPAPPPSPGRSFPTRPAPLHETGGAPQTHPGRNEALYREARSMNRRGWSKEATYQALLAFNLHHCDPPHSDSEVLRACNSAYERYEQGRVAPWEKAGASAWS